MRCSTHQAPVAPSELVAPGQRTMSPRQPRITAAQLLRALRRDGWEIERQRGGHAQLAHTRKPGLITVPRHPGEILKSKTLAAILEQAGLSVDDLRRLL
jgi:predicted RNA binding protein YcfA (HicA-like mRNA interferase family)